MRRIFVGAALLWSAGMCVAQGTVRVISADMAQVKGPRDMAWALCVGSAHAGLLVSEHNQAQLARTHRELGFEFVRFHGIFTDDMHVYTETNGVASYDWSKVDALYDGILKAGMKPFVELSFMPKAMASGAQETFWWHAMVTPPKDEAKWVGLITAFTRHLEQRYGEQVKGWYFEVWNEPNFHGFWPKENNQAAYLKLYDATAAAVKAVNPAYRVGGPATAGADWVPEFLAHAAAVKAPVDFVSTHTYGVSAGFLDADGKADLVLSSAPDAITGDVKKVRAQIAASTRPELPLMMTEWSASYSSRDPVHDSYTSAAFVLDKLKGTEGVAQAMSYWTYSDLFEENGPAPEAFHGGFGLLTRDDLPKATYFAYKYLHELGATELVTEDSRAWVTRQGGDVQALFWDESPLAQTEGNKALYRRVHVAGSVRPVELRVNGMAPGRYGLTVYRTGYKANDAYTAYMEMGLPKDLSAAQVKALQGMVRDVPETTQMVTVGAGGTVETRVVMRENDVVLVKVERVW